MSSPNYHSRQRGGKSTGKISGNRDKNNKNNGNRSGELDLKSMANALRCLSLDAIARANSGHPGLPLGFADVVTVLFSKFLKFSASKPKWADRDRFILSAGHGSMLLYSLLYLTSYEDCTLEDIKNFRQLHSKTAGHPEYGLLGGIEATTGPLGQGVANAVGMAIAERHLNARFGDRLVNHKTYCMVGDGCLMEGISYEALSIAGNLCLKNLVLLWDDNRITIDGDTAITRNENMRLRMESIGFQYLEADGHDYGTIEEVLNRAQKASKPTFIAFRTKIGFGSPKEGSSSCHGSPIRDEELVKTKYNLGCADWGEFEISADIMAIWREIGSRCDGEFFRWKSDLEKSPDFEKFSRIITGNLPADWKEKLGEFREHIIGEKPKEATRKSSQRVLEFLTANIEELLGGSADLTASVLTGTTSTATAIAKNNYGGRYINYGIREHAMAAIMNGLALHGGIIPYAGTFACFADYEKPALRLAALMGIRCLFILTHDSIGLGEDGPTHQPVEHLASLRAIPNLNVFRPADLEETLDCYELALENRHTPSAIILSRQSTPFIENKPRRGNLVARGAYVLRENSNATVTIIATGTEVSLALATADVLQRDGIECRVVSAPCLDIFDRQEEDYRNVVLGVVSKNNGMNSSKVRNKRMLRVAMEAACSYGWHRYIGDDGLFFGIPDNRFGISAPAGQIYDYFGLTPKKMAEKIKKKIADGSV